MPVDFRVWHHVVLTAYGAWIYGDSRGFRTRHHRQHVDGDYKNPPPSGKYRKDAERSRSSLAHDAVNFSPRWRPIVGTAVMERLRKLGAWPLCIAVARQHVHLLVKIPNSKLRQWIGRAKMHATFVLHERGWQGKVWAVRCKTIRVRNRAQQVKTYRYICDHVNEGAWVNVWRDDPGPAGPGLSDRIDS